MNLEQHILYFGKNYKILFVEQEFIIHPVAFGLLPLSTASLQCSFSSSFQMNGYHLILETLTLSNSGGPKLEGERMEGIEQHYTFQDLTVSYNGSILIGADQVKEYNMKGNKTTCFSYQHVYELVFEDGILITTIDQSKAMSRIRKNVELGLRSLSKNRDIRCILRFMNSSFIGDYNHTFTTKYKRMKYLKDMKYDYNPTELIKQIAGIE